MPYRLAIGLAVAGAALLSAAPAGAGSTVPKKTIRIGDNYYLPSAPTVRRGTTIVWKWPSFENSGQVHDVKLKKGPRGVKRFHSAPAASDYTYKRRLTVPGTYRLVCTYHDDMAMTIRVKR